MLRTPLHLILAFLLTVTILLSSCQWLLSLKKPPANNELGLNAASVHGLALEELAAGAGKIIPEEVPQVAVAQAKPAAANPTPPVLQRQPFVLDGQNFDLLLPLNWTSAVSENLIVLTDETGQERGEITLVGYYENYVASLPNHSETISEEDSQSPLGNGKLFVLERSYPAAANNNEIWQEIYTVIPIPNKNLAYLLWIKADPQESIDVNKDLLRFILNHLELSEQHL